MILPCRNAVLRLLFFLLFLISISFSLSAQTPVVTDIVVEGANDLETSQVLFKLESQVNEPLNRKKIIQDIKTIYDMGLFKDVRVELDRLEDGFLLRFVVVERPRIQALRFEGRRALSEDTLLEELTTKTQEIYDPVKVKQDENIIRDLYRKDGYARVKVSHRIEEVSERDYIIHFVIDETPIVYLTDIHVAGTEVFSELQVKRFMQSSEIDCVSWINESGVFQEEKINQDLALITQFYLRDGYIKVFIEKPKVIVYHNPDYSQLKVFLDITEGEQYFTGKVDITGDILHEQAALADRLKSQTGEGFSANADLLQQLDTEDKDVFDPKADLLEQLKLKEGEVYNPFLQNEDRTLLNQIYQEQGYAFVRIIPRTTIHEETRTVDVTYDILRNEKAYIGRIEFSGNTETRDYVIRRELAVQEGELYNGKKLRRSQANMERLGFFEPGLAIDREPIEDEDNILDMTVRLKEAQTGTFQAQLGFSEVSRLSGGFSVSKGNLFGRGQTLRFSAQAAQQGVQNDFSITFIEPRLFGSRISTSVTVSQRRISNPDLRSQDRIENSFSTSIGFPLRIIRNLRLSFRFSAVDRLFEEQVPSVIKRSIAPTLSYNTVNHPIFPSNGINTSFSIIQTGGDILGGNTRLREYNYRYQQFWSLNEDRTLVLMAQARLGWLEQVANSRIPAEDRFRIGGIATIRGHNLRAIAGPFAGNDAERHREVRTVVDESGGTESDVIDERTRDLTEAQLRKLIGGGISQRIFNMELVFPLTSDETSNVRGVVFYDAGNVNAESIQYALLDEKEPGFFDVRQSVGAGVRLITPVGVLRFEYGQKLDQREGEAPDKFEFNISGLF